MHPSSQVNMKKAVDILGDRLGTGLNMVDVGGRAIEAHLDRSFKPMFEGKFSNYYVADIMDGFNVTHIMKEQYTFPFDDNSIDLVVSGSCLEHVKNPFRSIADMKRILKPGGFMILIAPSEGKTHEVVDCWRFLRDSFTAIAEDVGVDVIADWIDREATDVRSVIWKDHTFVGQKPLG
jgi:SAM-dependent methyltransferase